MAKTGRQGLSKRNQYKSNRPKPSRGTGISREPPEAPIRKPTTCLITPGPPVFNLVSSPYGDVALLQIEERGYKGCVCPTREITPCNLGQAENYLRELRYAFFAALAPVVSLFGCGFGCLVLVWWSFCLRWGRVGPGGRGVFSFFF